MKRLVLIEEEKILRERVVLKEIIFSFDNLILKVFSLIRFIIIPLRFLRVMIQYLPQKRGRVLDFGCGFGLFTLYFARMRPEVEFVALDLSEKRIRLAKQAAERLNIRNVTFICQDGRDYLGKAEDFDSIITMDLLHHIEPEGGNQIIKGFYKMLKPGGVLLTKDVTTRPRLMVYFTFILDFIMNPKDVFYYRSANAWIKELKNRGFFKVQIHYLWDILPYPHILLISEKKKGN